MSAEVTQMVTALGHRLGLAAGAVEVQDGQEYRPGTPPSGCKAARIAALARDPRKLIRPG